LESRRRVRVADFLDRGDDEATSAVVALGERRRQEIDGWIHEPQAIP